ncbi:MAG: amidohydrolase [Nocardioidaceae bacterium]
MSVRVFRNGTVFTADAAGSIAAAVAVRDGRIVAVGGDADVAPFLDQADEVVDLDGRLLTPGFHDAHAHPIQGGLERIRCDLSGMRDIAAYQQTIAAYAAANPDAPWILGGGWSMEAFPGGTPTRELLDAVVSDRPVVLPNRDHHSSWANSRALEAAGIDEHTPDPADGRIERDARGVPTGALHEGAMDLVEAIAPMPTADDHDRGLAAAQAYLHGLGVVGWQDAWVLWGDDPATLHQTYLRAARAGDLTAHVSAALWWNRDCTSDGVASQVEQMSRIRRETPATDRYRVTSVKIMQDGVAETFTAGMLEPYLDRHGHPTDNAGLSFLPAPLLNQVVAALDTAGFQVHFHALGDRAVREVLDALARLPRRDARHHLAHLQVVHPDDRARFHALGATANLQALWATHEPQMDELTIPFLGARRTGWQYPFRSLYDAGATLAMGSDWPVSSPDPWQAIHVAVNRTELEAPDGTPPLGAEEALPLAVALRAYTAGSAWVTGLERRSGTIAVGMDADLVVCDRDPFLAPAVEIGRVRVEATYVAGNEVYRR